jgi:endo-alpha-1,4-polygalactosaminidase (GH114 family)
VRGFEVVVDVPDEHDNFPWHGSVCRTAARSGLGRQPTAADSGSEQQRPNLGKVLMKKTQSANRSPRCARGSIEPRSSLDLGCVLAMALPLSALLAACFSQPVAAEPPLHTPRILEPVRSWAIQLQGLDARRSRPLSQRQVDLLVLEPMRSQRGEEGFPMRALVSELHASAGVVIPHKHCLAYLNVGQAEDYRAYWSASWRAPTATGPGEPSFLLALDPDGWEGNYPVAFWRPEWKRCLFGHAEAPLDQLLADGFDGIYCDWVLGFCDPNVVAAAAAEGVDPADEMLRLLHELRDYGRAGQLGLERDPADYVATLVQVFALLRKLLTDDGTLWLNVGDVFAASGKGGGGNAGDRTSWAT